MQQFSHNVKFFRRMLDSRNEKRFFLPTPTLRVMVRWGHSAGFFDLKPA